MKLLALLSVAGSLALFTSGSLPCPCDLAARLGASGVEPEPGSPAGLYVEVRNATVWGGACHIGSEAVSQGELAASGWAFDGGEAGGVGLAGVRVVAVLEGSSNLQAEEVFRAGAEPAIRSRLWVDAPSGAAADAAVALVRSRVDLGAVTVVRRAGLTVARAGDRFTMDVPGALSVEGEAMPDRSCCTMPESRWYSPLDPGCDAVVGNPHVCRFEGAGSGRDRLAPWAFEGENSAFVGSIDA